MPRGVPLPNGTMWQKYRPRWPFDIEHLQTRNVDPRDFEPRWPISERKRMAEIDPDKVLAEMSLDEILEIWAKRYQIKNKCRQHDSFEVMMHLIFPKPEERALAYIAIWRFRDKLPIREIQRRLGKRKRRQVHYQTVKKYMTYVEKTVNAFCNRTNFRAKFAGQLKADMMKVETYDVEEDVREIIGERPASNR